MTSMLSDLMCASSKLAKSILDERLSTLDDAIWDDAGSEAPKLKADVHRQVWEGIRELVGNLPVERAYIAGSITSYRYLPDADVDVSLTVRMTDEEYDALKENVAGINGRNAVGTEHPINYFLMRADEPVGMERYDSVYDLQTGDWLKPPSDHGVDLLSIYDKFSRDVSSVDASKADAWRALVDLKLLKEALKAGASPDQVKIITEKIKRRLKDLDGAVDYLAESYDAANKQRLRAFSDYLERAAKGDTEGLPPSPNLMPENVAYKLLERYHYLTFMHALNNLVDESGDIDSPEDIAEVEDILSKEGTSLDKEDVLFFGSLIRDVLKGRKSFEEGTIRFFASTGRKHVKTGNRWPIYRGDKQAVNEAEGGGSRKRPVKEKVADSLRDQKASGPYVPKKKSGKWPHKSWSSLETSLTDAKYAIIRGKDAALNERRTYDASVDDVESHKIISDFQRTFRDSTGPAVGVDNYIRKMFLALQQSVEISDEALEEFPNIKVASDNMEKMREIRHAMGSLVLEDSSEAYAPQEEVKYETGDVSLSPSQISDYTLAAYLGLSKSKNNPTKVKNARGVAEFYKTLTPEAQKDFIIGIWHINKVTGQRDDEQERFDAVGFGNFTSEDLDLSDESVREMLDSGGDVKYQDAYINGFEHDDRGDLLFSVIPNTSPDVLRAARNGLQEAGVWETHDPGHDPDRLFSDGGYTEEKKQGFESGSFTTQFNEVMHYHPDSELRREWRDPKKVEQEGEHTDWKQVDIEDIDNYEEWAYRAVQAWGHASESVDTVSIVGSFASIGVNVDSLLWVANKGGFPIPKRHPTSRSVAFAKRLYEETQEFHKDLGDVVRLYRGMADKEFTNGVVESWTSDEAMGDHFAHTFSTFGHDPVVLTADVPVSAVLLSHESHALDWSEKFVASGEFEYVLLGGALGSSVPVTVREAKP